MAAVLVVPEVHSAGDAAWCAVPVVHRSNAGWQQCLMLAEHTLHPPLLPLCCIFRTLLCKTPSMLEGVQARSHSSGWNLPPRTPPDLSQFGLQEKGWGPACNQSGENRPPPPPHHPPSVPSHVLCTTGEGVHRVAGGQTWIRDVSPFLPPTPRCFSGADVHRGEQTPPPTGSTAPNGAVHESWGPSQSSTSSAPMCWAQLPSGRGCSVCGQPPASLHLVPAGGWIAKPPPPGCWHRQLEAGSACWDTLSCPCGGRRGGNNHGRPLAQHREP